MAFTFLMLIHFGLTPYEAKENIPLSNNTSKVCVSAGATWVLEVYSTLSISIIYCELHRYGLSFFICTHLFFQESCLSGLCWILIFHPNFILFWIFLNLAASVNIHVIKLITWSLADVWYINFSSDPTDILCVRTGSDSKRIVK